jgi:glycosyltransferase involved in cell wall biosynthesis
LRVCTIIARNYWAHARVLAASLHEHHPDVVLKVLVIDGDDETVRAAARERFDVVLPGAIGVDEREFRRMAAIYDILELSTAVKPWLMRTLLKEDGSPVVYLDPDIELFAPLTEAAELADARGIVLTPHTLEPLPVDGYEPSELTILGSGTYNLGFIAVGRDAFGFLDWWADHLRRDGLISKEEGMFVDQRWIDLAPSLFDVHIVRDPGWNVAYWNLAQRPISRFGNRLEASGRPLRFFHYSGFDPDRPRLSLFQGENPRVRLEQQPVVSELCERYAKRLIDAGYRAHSRLLYGYGQTANGLALDQTSRRLYRRELVRAERTGVPEPPNPFGPDARDDFESWLRDPAGSHGVTRYLRAVHAEQPALQVEYPDLDGIGGRAFLWWAITHGVKNGDVLPRLIEPETLDGVRQAPGVNIAGYMRAESGVGEASRLLVSALDAAGIPFSAVTYDNTDARQLATPPRQHAEQRTNPIDVICVNADQLHHFLGDVSGFDDGRYRVGVWAWEVDVMPAWMGRSSELVDEIWTYSAHAAHAIRAATSKPVRVVPPPILRPHARPLSRSELDLPEGFVFLFSFDFASVFERKNPLAVIEAFGRAFEGRAGVHLVIKTVGGDRHPEQLERLVAAAGVHENVSVRDAYVTREEHQALVSACDAFVSLHRAEGYGLHLAEAMALGKPVIATGYSGNLEFMDDTNSVLVPYELVPVPAGCDPYPSGARWAEPDIDAAAASMRDIVEDRTLARTLGERAAADVARLHSPAVRGRLVADLLGRVPPKVAAVEPEAESDATGEATVVEGRDVLPFHEVFDQVKAGPPVAGPTTKMPRLVAWIRGLLSRVNKNAAEHQKRVDLTIAYKVNHLLNSTEDLPETRKLIEELTVRIRELDARLIKEREYRRELAEELRRTDPDAGPGSAARDG